MKTKAACLFIALSLMTTLCMAQGQQEQQNITVQAQNSDISNNLDLKAVATAFGESRDLQEFEKKLNDYDTQISNLDLNKDGQVDYLRVIEKTDNGVHVVVIQAVLAKDVYQDVASIIVEKDQNNNPTVQVVGDPYIYGDNYIIDPGYLYTPAICSFFWGADYFLWNSPYYWGYYPHYYRGHSPYGLNVYLSNVYSHVNHNQRYYYTNNIRNAAAASMIRSVSRNDLAVSHPEQSFSNRNVNVSNKLALERSGSVNGMQARPSYQSSASGVRPVRSMGVNSARSQSYQNQGRITTQGNNVRSNTYTMPSRGLNSNINRSYNSNYQMRTNGGTPAVRQQSQGNSRQQAVRSSGGNARSVGSSRSSSGGGRSSGSRR